jgi:hypothetical protein
MFLMKDMWFNPGSGAAHDLASSPASYEPPDIYLYICSVDSVLRLFHSASGSAHDITLHVQSPKGPDRDLHHAAPFAGVRAGFAGRKLPRRSHACEYAVGSRRLSPWAAVVTCPHESACRRQHDDRIGSS